MTTTKTFGGGYDLETGTIYARLDDAMKAASCLCALHPEGVTVYGTTVGPDLSPETKEAYRIACKAERRDGTTWPVPEAPYEPIYTITRARKPEPDRHTPSRRTRRPRATGQR